jgi:pimeloyl-ACP methyl ester carboxylesterase
MRCRIVALALLAALSSSCVANHAYHAAGEVHREELTGKQFDPLRPDIANHVSRYRLSFIEFDDRGELFKRGQLETALKEIDKARMDAAPDDHPLVVVFIHGWKDNASQSNGKVWGFRQVLAQLSLGLGEKAVTAHVTPHEVPVLGIYIGWRGAVISAPILKEFTFFDRRRKSQSLPNAQMVESLTKIMTAVRKPLPDRSGAMSVLIGHSFGGAVLETALTDSLLQATLHPTSSASVAPPWPADLVIFINEAQEAIRSYQLIETMHANLPPAPPCTREEDKARPVVLSMTSTGDYATRAFYPAAQSLLRPFNSLRSYTAEDPNFLGFTNQAAMFFNTTAHVSRFQSHVMGRADDPEIASALSQCAPAITVTVNGIAYAIVQKPGALNRTPYWVMHVPSAIVPDHSTFLTPVFSKLLSGLIMKQTP